MYIHIHFNYLRVHFILKAHVSIEIYMILISIILIIIIMDNY